MGDNIDNKMMIWVGVIVFWTWGLLILMRRVAGIRVWGLLLVWLLVLFGVGVFVGG